MIVKRLMVGLKYIIKNPINRYRHIMEKMIYVCDINIKNMKIYHELFDREKKLGLKLNFFRGSFLSKKKFDNKMKDWGITEFDIIIGNPPYQVNGASGDNKLYLDFTKKSLFLLKNKESILLFITPKNILEYMLLGDKNRKYFDKFYQIDYLCIDTPSKYFKVGSTFLYFMIINKNYETSTTIEYLTNSKTEETTNIFLNKGDSIPNKLSKIDLSIINKIKLKTNNIFNFKVMKFNDRELRIRKAQINNGTVSTKQTNDYKYPIIDGINKNTPFPGKLYYSKYKMMDNKMKIILNRSGYLCPSIDENGDYFLSDNIFSLSILNKNEFNNFKSISDSKTLNYWLTQFRLNGFSDEKNIRKFPKMDLSKTWTEQKISEFFNLTNDEIKHIDNVISDIKIKEKIIEDSNFKVGEYYEYTGKSKKINSKEVELLKILKTTYKIKDTIGNITSVSKKTLKKLSNE